MTRSLANTTSHRDAEPYIYCFFVLNLVFLSRYMQSEGLWQRQHAAATQPFPSIGIPLSCPRTSSRGYSGGLTTSPSPHVRQKAQPHTKEKSKTPPSPPYLTRDRRKGNKTRHHSPMAPCSSPPTSSISTSGPSSPSTPRVSVSGTPLFLSLRGGGGDLYPLDACWAIFLATQASALAP